MEYVEFNVEQTPKGVKTPRLPLLVTYSFHVLVDSKERRSAGIMIIYWKVTRRTTKQKPV